MQYFYLKLIIKFDQTQARFFFNVYRSILYTILQLEFKNIYFVLQ